jgi:hypothetical protein
MTYNAILMIASGNDVSIIRTPCAPKNLQAYVSLHATNQKNIFFGKQHKDNLGTLVKSVKALGSVALV